MSAGRGPPYTVAISNLNTMRSKQPPGVSTQSNWLMFFIKKNTSDIVIIYDMNSNAKYAIYSDIFNTAVPD